MHDAEKLIIRKADYRDEEEFLFNVFEQFKILIRAKQVFSFHENPQNRGVYVIQYGPSIIDESSSYPVWLNADEILAVTAMAKFTEYQKAQQTIEEYEQDNHHEEDDNFGNLGGNHSA